MHEMALHRHTSVPVDGEKLALWVLPAVTSLVRQKCIGHRGFVV